MAKNQCAGAAGGVYHFYIERPRLASVIGRAIWGIKIADLYTSMRQIGQVADGATIVDVPSGGGVALRALAPHQQVRYIAVDIDPDMLARTRAKAAALGLNQVETVEADMCRLPFDEASVDLLCTYSGLHMIDKPETAIAEFARVLRPGGRLLGSTFVHDGSRRQRAVFEAGARRGHAVPPPDAATLESWLGECGLTDVELSGRGFVTFSATAATAAGP